MKKQSYKKGWAFLLMLAMAFTMLFGGFGFVGINGVVGEAYAADLTVGTGGTYSTLALALSSAVNGDTIKLTSDIVESVVVVSKTIMIDGSKVGGGQYKITAEAGGATSSALSLSGAGTVTLKDIILQGGAATGTSGKSAGLIVSDSVNVQSIGTVNSFGGASSLANSYGMWTAGSGTVNVSNATGGTGWSSYGVQNTGSGTVNVSNATGGTATSFSTGTFSNTAGTINVTNATGGEAQSSHGLICYAGTVNNVTNAIGGSGSLWSYGVSNYGGKVNVHNATAGTSTTSTGVFCANSGAVTNVASATGSTAGVNTGSSGVINTDANVTILTLNKGTGAYCVLDSITIASSGATQVGVLPQVTKNGVLGDWYTDSAKTTTFSGTTVNGVTNLYSTFYEPMTASTLTSFGSQTVGYASAPVAQTVTITNTGNQEITLTQPAITNLLSNFSIGDLTSTTLATESLVTFTVQPKTGLAVGTYNETINITGSNSASTSVSAQFVVNDAATGGGSGSSSGGSSSGSTTATTVINTNTGSITGNQLNNAAGVAKDGGTVTINSNKNNEVTFPTSGLDSLSGKNNSLTVVTDNGTLSFNSKAVAAMGAQATATDIKVIVDDVVKTTLTEDQQTKVGDKTVYDLTVMSGGKHISSFNGGKVNVSIPYELKAGETADNVTVWYMADNGGLTEINCTYDAKNKAVTFVVDHFSKYIIGYDDLAGWTNPFTDVKSSAWYYNAAAFVNVNGLMKGQTDTTFGPQGSMTRGMFVAILGRMEGIDSTKYADKNTFSDVKSNQYYAPYIAWASDKGIVTGMGGDQFAPNAAVTREQMAVMMTNYMKFKGQGPTGAWVIQLTYGDLDKVSSWANEGVMFLTMKDLMKGMGNDANGNSLFEPKSTSTRAQTAQVMMNLEELLK